VLLQKGTEKTRGQAKIVHIGSEISTTPSREKYRKGNLLGQRPRQSNVGKTHIQSKVEGMGHLKTEKNRGGGGKGEESWDWKQGGRRKAFRRGENLEKSLSGDACQ